MRFHTTTAICSLVGMAFCVAFGAASPPEQKPVAPLDIESLLPADGTVMDVMELKAPPRLEELAAKLQQTVAKDPEWWLAHVRKAKPGEPIPYDARLGLSKEEFDEFLSLAKFRELTSKWAIESSDILYYDLKTSR